jgi:hypothetical protein
MRSNRRAASFRQQASEVREIRQWFKDPAVGAGGLRSRISFTPTIDSVVDATTATWWRRSKS